MTKRRISITVLATLSALYVASLVAQRQVNESRVPGPSGVSAVIPSNPYSGTTLPSIDEIIAAFDDGYAANLAWHKDVADDEIRSSWFRDDSARVAFVCTANTSTKAVHTSREVHNWASQSTKSYKLTDAQAFTLTGLKKSLPASAKPPGRRNLILVSVREAGEPKTYHYNRINPPHEIVQLYGLTGAYLSTDITDTDFPAVNAQLTAVRSRDSDHLEKAVTLVGEVNDAGARVRAWLCVVKLIEENIDPLFDPADVPLLNVAPPEGSTASAGAAPEAIHDPKMRREYQEAIDANEAKARYHMHETDLRRIRDKLRQQIGLTAKYDFSADATLKAKFEMLVDASGVSAEFREGLKPKGNE